MGQRFGSQSSINHIIISESIFLLAVSGSINIQSSTSCPIQNSIYCDFFRGDGEMGDRERLGVKMSRDWESWSGGTQTKFTSWWCRNPGLSPVGSHVKHCKRRGGYYICIYIYINFTISTGAFPDSVNHQLYVLRYGWCFGRSILRWENPTESWCI